MEDRGSPAANQRIIRTSASMTRAAGWLRPDDSVGGMTLVYNEKPLAPARVVYAPVRLHGGAVSV